MFRAIGTLIIVYGFVQIFSSAAHTLEETVVSVLESVQTLVKVVPQSQTEE